MKKVILFFALLLVPTQVFAGALNDYNTNILRARYRYARSSTAAARQTNVFSRRNTSFGSSEVFTLEKNYHEASYINSKRQNVAKREKAALARLAKIEQAQKKRARQLKKYEERLALKLYQKRKLQGLREQAYEELPESEKITVGKKAKEYNRTPRKAGAAGNWVRKVLFDWNS